MSALQSRIARRELGRELTRIANASVKDVLRQIGNASLAATRRVGFTGPPGAGKSTLVSALAGYRLERNACETVCVLAIDPSSPVSGGSILGDRIRMDAIAQHPGLFIRSVPSRSAQNGLCDNVVDLLAVIESHAFDEVFLETVGTGQSEVDIRELVDTVVLLVPPDAGDSIQAMKAGILEIADIYVVTKSENPAATRMAAEISSVIASSRREGSDWQPAVIQTKADGTGIDTLSATIDHHREYVLSHSSLQEISERRRRFHLKSLANRAVDQLLRSDLPCASSDLGTAFANLAERLSKVGA